MDIHRTVADLLEASVRLESGGDIAQAMERAAEALGQARAADDLPATLAALIRIGLLHFRLGHYAEAQALGQEVLAQSEGNAPARVDALLLLGLCATETDDLDAGEEYYRQAIDLSRQLGYRLALLRGLHNLAAGVYMPRGQFDLAVAADTEVLRLADEVNASDLVPFALIILGWVYCLKGQWRLADEAVARLSAVVPPGSALEGYRCCLLALLAQARGDLEQAEALYGQAHSIGTKTGEISVNILVRLGISRLQRACGNASAAHQWANDAATIAARAEYLHLEGMALVERGRASWELGDALAAETDWRAAVQLLQTIGAAFDLARARLFLAALLHQQERAEAAAAWRDAARSITQANYGFLVDQERATVYPLVAAYARHSDAEIAALTADLLEHLARVPAHPLQVFTLGRFEVRRDRRAIPAHAWRQRRAGELFRMLLLAHRRTLTRDQVVEALWPNKPPDSAQALLHQATSALRRALEPGLPDKFPSQYLHLEEGQIVLTLPSESVVDFEEFEARVRAKDWEAALCIYQGDLFPDDIYADWSVLPRERLRRLHMSALYGASRARMEAGQAEAALDACHRILEMDPWQEEAVLLGMEACMSLHDRAGALRLYRTLEQALREELNTTPQEPLRRLYHSLLRDEQGTATP